MNLTNIMLLIGLLISLLINFVLIKTNKQLRFKSRSLSIKYGKFSEQFFPFIDEYPYDSRMFRFLGSPVDGVQFDDDKIVFVEFKVGNSKLSSRERKIKGLVENKKVYFEEFKIK